MRFAVFETEKPLAGQVAHHQIRIGLLEANQHRRHARGDIDQGGDHQITRYVIAAAFDAPGKPPFERIDVADYRCMVHAKNLCGAADGAHARHLKRGFYLVPIVHARLTSITPDTPAPARPAPRRSPQNAAPRARTTAKSYPAISHIARSKYAIVFNSAVPNSGPEQSAPLPSERTYVMTQKILHIDSSARLNGSTSRELTARIVEKLGGDVVRRDLSTPLPLIDETWVNANFTPPEQRTEAQTAALALSDSLIGELRAADVLVIGVPIYNFGIPATLKAWVDQVARAGVTCRTCRCQRRDRGRIGHRFREPLHAPCARFHRHHGCGNRYGRPDDDRRGCGRCEGYRADRRAGRLNPAARPAGRVRCAGRAGRDRRAIFMPSGTALCAA